MIILCEKHGHLPGSVTKCSECQKELESALRELMEAADKCRRDVECSAADLLDEFGCNWIRNNIERDLEQIKTPLANARKLLDEGGRE